MTRRQVSTPVRGKLDHRRCPKHPESLEYWLPFLFNIIRCTNG